MKRIEEVTDPTPGLSSYLASVEDGDWDEFRSHRAGASLLELREVLTRNQHELCAYCETSIPAHQRQIEHVVPRSDPEFGSVKELDIANLVICCLGGQAAAPAAKPSPAPSRRLRPSRLSCGQAKGDRSDGDFVDPRRLPSSPPLFSVGHDGRIGADRDACAAAGWAPERIEQTIGMVNLNTERLRLVRERRWNDLVESGGDLEDPKRMEAWVRSVLTPDENGRLDGFFTTSRCYFASLGERILAKQPQAWI